MSMNTSKILELLGTTPAKKLNTLHKEESFPVCSEESANEMLNADLFGTKKVSKPVARRTAPVKSGAATESVKPVRRVESTMRAKSSATESARPRVRRLPVTDADRQAMASEVINPVASRDISASLPKAKLTPRRASRPVEVDESASCEGSKCIGKGCKSSKEMIVETTDSKFPESFDFDEQAFGDEYGIDVETISCVFVPEDPQAKIAEHIEVSFTYDESNVVLSIYSDNTVTETVDAEEVDAQFSAEFTQEEDEDGNLEDVLLLNLIDEEEDEDANSDVPMSEDDVAPMSEGDAEHYDENGDPTTDEFVEEAGLNIDGFYSDRRGLKKADKGVHEVKANEADASSANVSPLVKKYYDVVSLREFADRGGYDSIEAVPDAEYINNYIDSGLTVLGYLVAKPKYFDMLSYDGEEIGWLIKHPDEDYAVPYTIIRDRLYLIDLNKYESSAKESTFSRPMKKAPVKECGSANCGSTAPRAAMASKAAGAPRVKKTPAGSTESLAARVVRTRK